MANDTNTANHLVGISRNHIVAALRAVSALNGHETRTDDQAIAQIASWEKATDDWMALLAEAGARPLVIAPPVGQVWTGQGGTYAGLQLDEGVVYHTILADAKPDTRLNHADAIKWAASVTADGHTDFALPSQKQNSLLFANVAHLLDPAAHWSSTQYSRLTAWCQTFGVGTQYVSYESAELRARAVRRFIA